MWTPLSICHKVLKSRVTSLVIYFYRVISKPAVQQVEESQSDDEDDESEEQDSEEDEEEEEEEEEEGDANDVSQEEEDDKSSLGSNDDQDESEDEDEDEDEEEDEEDKAEKAGLFWSFGMSWKSSPLLKCCYDTDDLLLSSVAQKKARRRLLPSDVKDGRTLFIRSAIVFKTLSSNCLHLNDRATFLTHQILSAFILIYYCIIIFSPILLLSDLGTCPLTQRRKVSRKFSYSTGSLTT